MRGLRVGLGYDKQEEPTLMDTADPTWTAGVADTIWPFSDDWGSPCASRIVYFYSLPRGTEPAYVHRILLEVREHVSEIYCPLKNSFGQAWVQFDTEESAAKAEEIFSGQRYGPLNRAATAIRVREDEVPKSQDILLLSDYLRKKPKNIRSRTVFVRNLPTAHTLRALNGLLRVYNGGHNMSAEEVPHRAVVEIGRAHV